MFFTKSKFLKMENKLNQEVKTISGRIKALIDSYGKEYARFTPNKQFYKTVKTNQKRWGMILSGDLYPSIEEIKAIASFFDVPVETLIED